MYSRIWKMSNQFGVVLKNKESNRLQMFITKIVQYFGIRFSWKHEVNSSKLTKNNFVPLGSFDKTCPMSCSPHVFTKNEFLIYADLLNNYIKSCLLLVIVCFIKTIWLVKKFLKIWNLFFVLTSGEQLTINKIARSLFFNS